MICQGGGQKEPVNDGNNRFLAPRSLPAYPAQPCKTCKPCRHWILPKAGRGRSSLGRSYAWGSWSLSWRRGYGFGVSSGLWLDDHLHFQQLQKAGWSFRDLLDASRLDAGVKRVSFWGSAEHHLRFFRPVAFGLMKAEYSLVGWRPGGMHVFNLLWHVAVAYMVGALVAGVLRDQVGGTLAALLFAAFPDHVLSVYWISCQPELMVTFFFLAATLAYGRWAGWFEPGPLLPPCPAKRNGRC